MHSRLHALCNTMIIVRICMWQPLCPIRNNKVILNGIILLLIHRRNILHEKCPSFICSRTYLLYCDHIWSRTQRRWLLNVSPVLPCVHILRLPCLLFENIVYVQTFICVFVCQSEVHKQETQSHSQ